MFFAKYPPLLNYAAYGYVIGHEITHGFDNNGANFNGTGFFKNWWTNKSIQQFRQRQACLVAQYNSFPVESSFVNGASTLGENIADLGGLSLAYAAYKALPTENRLIPQFSNDQLFWIYAGQVWCQASTKEAALKQLTDDVHSPGKYRIIGPMSNLKEFAQTWQCSPNSRMGRSLTADQCQVWNL